jgi:hypothetical protein
LVQLSPQSPSLDSRRRSTNDEFEAGSSPGVIERLRNSGVITKVEDPDAPSPESFELAHESLVTSWPRMRDWIEAQRSLLLWRQDLAAQAARWKAHNQDPALLLRGTPLHEAVMKSSEARLNAAEQMFVESSREADAERERIEQEQAEQGRRAEYEAGEAKRWMEQQAREAALTSARKTR